MPKAMIVEGEFIDIPKTDVNYYEAGEKQIIVKQPVYIRSDVLNLVGSRAEVMEVAESFGGEPFARVKVSHPPCDPLWIPYSCLS